MIIAWMMCASTALILSKYYKRMWPNSKLCGAPVWLAVSIFLPCWIVLISVGACETNHYYSVRKIELAYSISFCLFSTILFLYLIQFSFAAAESAYINEWSLRVEVTGRPSVLGFCTILMNNIISHTLTNFFIANKNNVLCYFGWELRR